MDQQPQVVILGGSNGAGKTTCAMRFLPGFKRIEQFVNADEIARGISPFAPESVALQAGRVMLSRIDELRARRTSFAFETTLAGRGYVRLLRDMRAEGYAVELIYVWLESPELAIERVARRVQLGGHHIPDDVVRRRYAAGARNLINLYIPLASRWVVCDNSRSEPRLAAVGRIGAEAQVLLPGVYDAIIHEGLENSGEEPTGGVE